MISETVDRYGQSNFEPVKANTADWMGADF
jgi:hypothetical protein